MHMQDLHADISDTHFTQVHSYIHLNMQMGYNTPTIDRNRLLNINMSLHLNGSVQYPPEGNQKYPKCRLTAVALRKKNAFRSAAKYHRTYIQQKASKLNIYNIYALIYAIGFVQNINIMHAASHFV